MHELAIALQAIKSYLTQDLKNVLSALDTRLRQLRITVRQDIEADSEINEHELSARVRAGERVVLLQEQVEREKKTQREQMAKLGAQLRGAMIRQALRSHVG